MELTTTQVIATAIILIFIAIVAGISYWAGYTSGQSCEYEHGRIDAGLDQQAERLQLKGELAEACRLLECRNRELKALRTNIEIEADDLNAEAAGATLWTERTSKHRDLYDSSAAAGLTTQPRRETQE